jgi:hypothetical protein
LFKEFLTCKCFDDFLGFLSSDGDNPKIILNGFFLNILKNGADFGIFLIGNNDTAHKSTCFLIDVDPDVFNWSVLIKNGLDVHVGEAAIYIFYI